MSFWAVYISLFILCYLFIYMYIFMYIPILRITFLVGCFFMWVVWLPAEHHHTIEWLQNSHKSRHRTILYITFYHTTISMDIDLYDEKLNTLFWALYPSQKWGEKHRIFKLHPLPRIGWHNSFFVLLFIVVCVQRGIQR